MGRNIRSIIKGAPAVRATSNTHAKYAHENDMKEALAYTTTYRRMIQKSENWWEKRVDQNSSTAPR